MGDIRFGIDALATRVLNGEDELILRGEVKKSMESALKQL